MLTDADVRANLAAVRARLAAASEAAGRDPAEVRLLLATKTVPAELIAAAVRAGATLIGENRVQELAAKDAVLSTVACERHFIGHLQTNKVNQVLRYVTAVQSVDRVAVADRLQRRLEGLDRTLDVLVQVNTSGETSKFGVPPAGVTDLVREVAQRDRLRVRGLMTIGLLSSAPEPVRASYRTLRQARDGAAADLGLELPVLSMGMSQDLELAVAEGATMVRVGSAVFGARPTPP